MKLLATLVFVFGLVAVSHAASSSIDISPLTSGIQRVLDTIKQILVSAVLAVTNLVKSVLNTNELINNIDQSFNNVINSIEQIINNLIDAIYSNTNGVANAIADTVAAIRNNSITADDGLSEISTILTNLINSSEIEALTEEISNIITAVLTDGDNIIDEAIKIIGSLLDEASNGNLDQVIDSLVNSTNVAANILGKLLNSVVNSIGDSAAQLIENLETSADVVSATIASTISNTINDLKSNAKNVIEGVILTEAALANGVTSFINTVAQAISSL